MNRYRPDSFIPPQPAASRGDPPRIAADCRVPPPCLKALANPATSFWLRRAIVELLKRDPIDALNDATALVNLMQARAEQVQADLFEESHHG